MGIREAQVGAPSVFKSRVWSPIWSLTAVPLKAARAIRTADPQTGVLYTAALFTEAPRWAAQPHAGIREAGPLEAALPHRAISRRAGVLQAAPL